jgi:hypothetical protein
LYALIFWTQSYIDHNMIIYKLMLAIPMKNTIFLIFILKQFLARFISFYIKTIGSELFYSTYSFKI